MKMRCYNPSNKGFVNYGGRGITVCGRWLQPEGKGFFNFLEDMGECPEGMSLDRIDNELQYSPANCKWSTKTDQCINRRKLIGSRRVTSTYKGVHKSGNGWRTTIYRNRKVVFDKYCKTEIEAHEARQCWLKENE